MKNLTEGNIYKTFILYAIPIVMSGVLSQAYNIIDSIIAGNYLGESGLAAIGATSAFITLITSIFWGYASGAALHVAILFGARDYKELKSVVFNNAILFVGLAFLTSALSLIFKGLIFDFLNVAPSIRAQADVYYTICIAFNFLLVLNPFFAFIFNSLGMSEYPFRMSVVSTVINICGNLLSVTVLKAGITGLAVSSVVAALTVDVFYIFKLFQCYEKMDVSKCKVGLSLSVVKKSVSFAIPVTAQQFIMYTATLIVSPIVNALGSSATAAYSVANRVYSFNANLYQNSSKTVTNYTAQCVGAKKYNQIRKGVRVGLLQGLLFLAPCLIACVVFAEPISRAFFPAGFEGEALEYSIVFLKLYLPFILFNVINNLFHSFFRGVKAMKMLITFTGVLSVARTVATLFLAPLYGMHGVYAGWVLSWIAEAIGISAAYLSNRWQKSLDKIAY